MDRRLALVLLLLSLFALVTGAGLWRARMLQEASADGGPHTLLRDGQGGFFLATQKELLHLDGGGALRDRHAAAGLGLTAFDAVASGEGTTLWVQDRRQRRLFRCDTSAWTCLAAGAPAAALGAPLQLAWLYGRDRRLLAADSAAQRLLTFDADGHPLPLPAQAWHTPQQVSTNGGEVLLAESGARRIVSVDPVANQAGAAALATQAGPVRFLRRDQQWWVLEGSAGAPLRLRHYLGDAVAELAQPLRDPVALLDGGRSGLLLASRDDWRLLALDPETGAATAFGDPALQQELQSRARARAEAQAALARLPWIVAALAVLTLFPVPLLLWQRRRAQGIGGSATATATPRRPATLPARAATGADTGRAVRIDTRRDLVADARPRDARLYDRHLVCGPDKVVLVVAGKPLVAVPYEDVWLGANTLLLGQLRLPLYRGRGAGRRAVWDVDALDATLAPRLPEGHRQRERALGMALLVRGRWQGLLILAGALPYGVAIPLILALVLECWRRLAPGFPLPPAP